METAKYGELNEFDPFWNYKATNYLIENGWDRYKEWNDTDSWVGCDGTLGTNENPTCDTGRNVSATSQTGLHLTTAFLYNFYDGDLYNFTILIPAVFGGLTVFPMYLLVSTVSKSRNAGLVASFFYAVSFAILMRNMAGWFKSEPLGLLLGISFLALFTWLIYREKINYKIIAVGIITGLTMTLAISSWIGSVTAILPVLLFGIIIPIFTKENKGLGQIMMIVGTTSILSITFFDRAESLFYPLPLVMIGIGVYGWLSHKLDRKIKIIILVAVIAVTILGLTVSDVSERYKTILLPFHTTDDLLVKSVAEHQLPNMTQITLLQGFLMYLAPIGIILAIKKLKTLDKIWLACFVGVLMYFGMSLIRLQMVLSISLIVLSAIGVVLLFNELNKSNKNKKITMTSLLYVAVLIMIVTPVSVIWINMADTPPTILSGGTTHSKLTNEWIMAMEFIKTTDPDAKIFAWWDYGYWISVLGERGTFMDNSTLYTMKILEYAKIFTMHPQQAHEELKKIGADYVLVYSTSMKQNGSYQIIAGGDELKSFWIYKIAGVNDHKIDNRFLMETLMGGMIPFIQTEKGYQMVAKQYDNYELVYVSPSYAQDEDGIRYGILIYKVL